MFLLPALLALPAYAALPSAAPVQAAPPAQATPPAQTDQAAQAAPPAQADAPAKIMDEQQRVVHLLSRLSYAPTPGTIAAVSKMGIRAWLDQQLAAAPPSSPELHARLKGMPTLAMDPAQARGWVNASLEGIEGDERRKAQRRQLVELRSQVLASLLLRGAASDRQAEEVLADFWRNHFNVSMGKGRDAIPMIPDWEREVLRGNLWGRFSEMLGDTARHPAMLHYLDQAQSRRPMTQRELERVRTRTMDRTGSAARAQEAVAKAEASGPNENYARELMELHTLGVDQVYTQDDVVAAAQAMTGWTFDRRPRGGYGFRFVPGLHWSGDKEFLGETLVEARRPNASQGERILQILASHEQTAEFVCTKLVSFLASDDPPQVLVRAATEAWRLSGGDLTTVLHTVLVHPAFYDPALFRAKVKTPWEFVVSALRVTGAELPRPLDAVRALVAMGQPLYHCEVPTGWPETADAWLDPGAMAYRWEFASQFTDGKLKGAKIPASFYLDTLDGVKLRQWPQALEKRVLPGGVGARTHAALERLVEEFLGEERGKRRRPMRTLAPQMVALLLGSPEFQQQ